MERVIGLKTIVARVLIKWKLILLVMLMFALALGGKKWISLRAVEAAKADSKEQAENSSDQALYKKEMSRIDEAVSKHNEYISNSLRMKIIPSEEGRASVNFYVSTADLNQDKSTSLDMVESDTQSSSSSSEEGSSLTQRSAALRKADQILDAYMDFIEKKADWSALAKEMDTRPEYIRELIDTRVDLSNAKASVIVIHPNEEGAKKILSEVMRQMEEQKAEIKSQFGDHQIDARNQTSGTVVDQNLARELADRIGEVNNLIVAQDNFKVNMNASVLKQDGSSALTRGQMLKTALSAAVKGAAAGAVLVILLLGGSLIFSKRILSGSEFCSQFELRPLAYIPNGNVLKRKGLDRLFSRALLQEYSCLEEEAAFRIAGENLSSVVKEETKIAVLGDLPEEQMRKSAEKMGKHPISYAFFPGMLQNAEELHAFKQCDKAILILKTGTSRYESYKRLIKTAKECRMKIAGVIVL